MTTEGKTLLADISCHLKNADRLVNLVSDRDIYLLTSKKSIICDQGDKIVDIPRASSLTEF
jgi:hypothetical protein